MDRAATARLRPAVSRAGPCAHRQAWLSSQQPLADCRPAVRLRPDQRSVYTGLRCHYNPYLRMPPRRQLAASPMTPRCVPGAPVPPPPGITAFARQVICGCAVHLPASGHRTPRIHAPVQAANPRQNAPRRAPFVIPASAAGIQSSPSAPKRRQNAPRRPSVIPASAAGIQSSPSAPKRRQNAPRRASRVF